ncbi:MAG: cobyrinate a,c-diamide synthase [Verrucomicrobia bacterium]|nr:cobyrinate a,c-diamide synthase [Verrucomicrobiota bacterium]
MQSSDGKTAITCMLLAALRARGVPVQPFKVGPDFIDPGYHTRVAGVSSRNLDNWLMGDDGIVDEVLATGRDRVSIVEGVMGLFDGSDAKSDEGSTMALARLLDRPVVLVVTAKKSGRSLAVALRGFIQEAGYGRIAGVILNGVSGSSHTDYLREAIEPRAVPVLGALPFCPELAWPERHLGLQASQERQLPSWQILASLAEQYLDINGILEIAQRAESGRHELALIRDLASARSIRITADEREFIPTGWKPRIGVAMDEAFHFYYQANLDYLTSIGAELINFSPLHDSALPADLDAIFIGGGFPEIFASQLAENSSMRAELRSAVQQGLNCYAECGGLMLLASELITLDQKAYPMAGVIPGAVQMTKALKHFGYCICSESETSPDRFFHGHEFHHSLWSGEPEHANLWSVRRKRGDTVRREGLSMSNLHASYVHLYFRTGSPILERFVKRERSL